MSDRGKDLHPSTWDYVTRPSVAETYDSYFAGTPLFNFDTQVLDAYFDEPAPLLDLGCGTGRHLEHFARRGFPTTGVDLSEYMIRTARAKLAAPRLAAAIHEANLLDLGFLAEREYRYVIMMFSTLGMIRGRAGRRSVVETVYDLLEPGGLFAFHVHNRWLNMFEPEGRRWLLWTYLVAPFVPGLQVGDKVMTSYRGVPNMYLHVFTLPEARSVARAPGFEIVEEILLNISRSAPVRGPLKRLRANGFIFICRKPGSPE